MAPNNVEPVTVVVCVKDCESMIRPCLDSIFANHPAEVVVVDGNSRDGTARVAAEMGAKVVSDEGRGLAYARRIGALSAKSENILYIGPDNVLPFGFISEMMRLGREYGFDVVGAQTRVLEPKTFSDRGLDFRWRVLMGEPGERAVIGTPTLYRGGVLQDTNYEERAANADDTDVAERMRKKGKRLGVVPVQVFDANGMTLGAAWRKFRWYGTGDAHFYRNHSPDWTLGRKLFSLSHPLRQTINFGKTALLQGEFGAFAWLVFVMAARYAGWIRKSRELRRRARA
ncbi:MAG: glycosyltransferase family 2 protein [Bdellovibrionales bacterium]|nr:glycosyltransferase family 2 protein [Bdellovibrionales bacterium]